MSDGTALEDTENPPFARLVLVLLKASFISVVCCARILAVLVMLFLHTSVLDR